VRSVLNEGQNIGNRSLTREISHDIGAVVPGKTVLLCGSSLVYYTSLIVMKEALRRLPGLAVVDGANRFDAYGLARMAQIDGRDPLDVLNRVYLSRVFTAFQMDGLLTRGVEPFMSEAKTKVLIVLGLLHTFYDEQISVREAEKSLAGINAKFAGMKKNGISILLASENLVPAQKQRQFFHRRMKAMADDIYEVSSGPYEGVVWNRQKRMLAR
jgi:hypothetical protein